MQSYDAQKRMQMFLNDSRTIGVSRSRIEETLTDRLTKSKANKLLDNDFIPPTYSEDAFESTINRMKREAVDRLGRLPEAERFRALGRAPSIFERLKNSMNEFNMNLSKEQFEARIDAIISPYIQIEQEQKPGIREIKGLEPRTQKPDLGPGITQNIEPSQQVVNVVNPLQGMLPTGLTRSETALLSPTEQAIRLRQRNIG
jgi:hypothetical protein